MEALDFVGMKSELDKLRKEIREKKENIRDLALTNKKLIIDCKLLKLTVRALNKGETQLIICRPESETSEAKSDTNLEINEKTDMLELHSVAYSFFQFSVIFMLFILLGALYIVNRNQVY